MELARETGHKIAQMMEKQHPEVEIVSFAVGQASDDNAWAAMQDNGSNILSYNIRLTEAKNRKKSIYDVSDELRTELAAMPEVHR
ncbi:MAG TPA: hypothetical protein DEB36_03430, partial [Porphyromonadaceae bacterium]|nr:hypothetical protein [Porphyromonadaceae bacterium]